MGFSVLTFFPVNSWGYSPPLPPPHQLSAASWAMSGEENTLILFPLAQPCFMEQNSQEIRQSTERILQLGPSTKLLTLWWSSVLNTIGCVETWNISSINLLFKRLSSTLIWRCDLTEMSNKFCFTAIISKLSREDVWKIRHHELPLPFPWSWFVTSSCVHFSSLKTLAMQTSLFTSH